LGEVKWLNPKPKWTEADNGCAAGHYTGGTFDGADTVPYNGVKAALEFWKKELGVYPLTVLDGDRFSNGGTVTWFRDNAPGHKVAVVHLGTTSERLDARRAERGSRQDRTWMKGRVTKAANFAKATGAVFISGEPPPQEVHREVAAYLKALR
jgi:hypothetical protein